MRIGLQNSDFTLETFVAHLVPQPWELTGVLGIPHSLQKGVDLL